jgi:hypothetical protein
MGADTIEVASGHCAMVSHPEETHERILTAANAAAVPGSDSARRLAEQARILVSLDAAAIQNPRGSNDRRRVAVVAARGAAARG